MNFTLPEDLERSVLSVVDGDRFATAEEVVTEAVREFLEKRPKTQNDDDGKSVYEVMERAGLIGMIDSGPGSPDDLSTNPIHMEGFGEHDRAEAGHR